MLHLGNDGTSKLTLDDGSSFVVKQINTLEEALSIQIQDSGKPPISRFVPYERIRFVDMLKPDRPPNIFEMFFTNPEAMFRAVPEDAAVRPLLNYNDLKLVRRALILLVQHSTVKGDMDKATRLFARILRKA
jgi:hypothetical protein